MLPWAHLALISALMILGSIEYCSLTKKSGIPIQSIWTISLSTIFAASLFYFFLNGAKIIPAWADLLFIFLAIVGTLTLQLRNPIKGHISLLAFITSLFGLLWIPWLFSFTARIDFVAHGTTQLPGAPMLLWCLAVTKFSDMGAYITGSLIGKNKMIPHVSPGKTWEGFAGGIIFPQLVAIALFLFMPGTSALFHHSWWHVTALALLVSLLAVIGDLAESLWKRSLDVKDSGHFLPGIGGALDLIDSLCFTAPVVYFYLIFTH